MQQAIRETLQICCLLYVSMMETKDFVQIAVFVCGLIAGIFIPPKVVLKTAGVLVAIAVIGLIVSTLLSQTLGWYFWFSAMAIWFAAVPALISGFLTSLVKRAFGKAPSE